MTRSARAATCVDRLAARPRPAPDRPARVVGRGSPRSAGPRARRSPIRAGRGRRARRRRSRPARRSRPHATAGWSARARRGGRPAAARASRAWSRPVSVSGTSVRPVWRPSRGPLGLAVADEPELVWRRPVAAGLDRPRQADRRSVSGPPSLRARRRRTRAAASRRPAPAARPGPARSACCSDRPGRCRARGGPRSSPRVARSRPGGPGRWRRDLMSG